MTAPMLDESVLEDMDFKPACEFCKNESATWSLHCLHWNIPVYKGHVGHKFTCDKCKRRILDSEKEFLAEGHFKCYYCKGTIVKYITEIVKL